MLVSRYLEEPKHGQEVRYDRKDYGCFYKPKEIII